METSYNNLDFIRYLETNIEGFNSFKVKATNLPGFGGCLVCNMDVKEGEELLRIPSSFFITLTVALRENPTLSMVRKLVNVEKKSLLAFFLFLESQNPSSRHFLYLNSIPETYSNPITWDEFEISTLRPELSKKYASKISNLLLQYSSIISTIQGSLANESNVEDLCKLTSSKFLQLVAAIESRTLFFKNEEDTTSDVGAMVPFYDMANHCFMENVDHFSYFFFDEKRKEYVMRAYKNFSVDEQIFITYGNYNNEHFLEYYGFIPYKNEREAIVFSIEASKLPKILGKEISNKLKENALVAQAILSHLFTQGQLKQALKFEVEEATSSFSWETETFLQIFSLDLPNEMSKASGPKIPLSSKPPSPPSKSKKKDTTKSIAIKKPKKDSGSKGFLTEILEAFNSNSITSHPCFNMKRYQLYAKNLKEYMLSQFEGLPQSKTELAQNMVKHEINLVKKLIAP